MTETFITMVEKKAGMLPSEIYPPLGISRQRYAYYRSNNSFPASLIPKLKVVTRLSVDQMDQLLRKAFPPY